VISRKIKSFEVDFLVICWIYQRENNHPNNKRVIMSLSTAYKTTRIIETLENYAQSDGFAGMAASDVGTPPDSDSFHPYSDRNFWGEIFYKPDEAWSKTFSFQDVGLSEWVARVPGLFFGKGSRALRKASESRVEFVSNGRWRHFTPRGKSERVMGGVGTISLPNEGGYYLTSISKSNNASTGIPVLIKEEIWEHHNLQEGSFFESIKGKWTKMSGTWSGRFPSVADIPKGYLKIEHPEDIIIDSHTPTAPTLFHPFSIMQYEKNGGVFYDYVYVTVDSTEEGYRDKIRAFFGEYEYYENRNGRYLIEPFVNNPLLNNVIYQSPKELRASSPTANAHLELLVNRIRNESFDDQTLDLLKISIDNHSTIDQLKRLSDKIGINPNRWFRNGVIVDESAALLDYCLQRNKIEELIDALSIEQSNIFTNN